MRILHTEWMPSVGGQAKRVLQELQAIQEFGWKPLLAASPKSWIYNEAKERGIETIPMEFKGAADIKSAIRLANIIQSKNIDIIHSHSSKDSYPAAYAAKWKRVKYVRSRHMDLTKKPGILYHLADAIIVTGSKIKKELQANGVKRPIYSIPSFPDANLFHIDPKKREEFRKVHDLKGVVVGALTGLKRDKRPHLLVEAIKDIKAQIIIAGVSNDTDYFQEFSEAIKGYDNIRYIGYVNPVSFLNAIDIYACPSKKEGIPQSIMQAMLCAKPVVSMDVGSIQDLNIQNNLFLANDEKEFAKHLKTLIQNEALRQAVGEKNLAIAKENFTYDQLKKRLKDVYENL